MAAAVSVIDPSPLYNPFFQPEPAAPRHQCPRPSIKPSLSQLAWPDPVRLTTPPSPPPMYGMLSPVQPRVDDPYDERHPSPSLSTRPASPFVDHPPENPFTSLHGDYGPDIPTPDHPERAPSADAIPNPDDGEDLAYDEDEPLSTLEKIYLLARSKASFHRIYIAHQLTSFLPEVTPGEAVEYVLPLLSGLATDEEESVKEALACELLPIMWWFISNCRVAEEGAAIQTDEPVISVSAFTPILGTLLLSPNRSVGGPARAAVVDILARIRATPDEANMLLGSAEKQLFEREMLYQVIIGMGRLDQDGDRSRSSDEDDDDDRPEVWWTAPSTPANPELFVQKSMDANINPYFPALPAVLEESTSPSPPSSASDSPQTTPSSGTPTPIVDVSANSFEQASVQVANSSSPTRSPQSLTPDLSPASVLSDPSPTSPPEPISPIQSSSLASPQIREEVIIGPTTQSPDRWESGISSQDMPEMSAEEMYPGDQDDDGSKVGVSVGVLGEGLSSDLEESDLDAVEQAAVGKVSSMSLMASLSATCSLNEDVQTAFVKEVERAGRDPIYWVRREASFALGALAKVVPLEIVLSSLLPLFESLCVDSEWHVRHSAIFALPGLLSRLPPLQRRLSAVKTVRPLARDPELAVRSGLLEALGEVIYTFRNDKDGPPEELLDLFLGRKPSDSRNRRRSMQPAANTMTKLPWPNDPGDPILLGDDPSRLLICAFNFPAVTLTLGRARWDELRDSYLALAKDPTPRVRKTLAASVGEMAKIIGPEHAKRDTVPLWLDSLKFEDSDVRLKATESMVTLLGALARPERVVLLQSLQQAWTSGHLRGWRERDCAARALSALVGLMSDTPTFLRSLLKLALQDDVAAIRAAAVSAVPVYFRTFAQRRDIIESLHEDVKQLASSPAFRKRNTYVSIQEALVLSDGSSSILDDNDLWRTLATLATDNIVDVRIGVSRLIALILDKSRQAARPLPKEVSDVVTRLRADISREVRSFVPDLSQSRLSLAEARKPSLERMSSIFSRPPSSRRSTSHAS